MKNPKNRVKNLIALAFIICSFHLQAQTASQLEDFQTWLKKLNRMASIRGISQATSEDVFNNIKLLPKVIELDHKQPEFSISFGKYLNNMLTKSRIQMGKEMFKKHSQLLDDIYKIYGIPPQYLVAFWGMETNYGNYMGSFNTISALATLSYNKRRRTFFTKELLFALRIIDDGHVSYQNMYGSWAGAMGHPQFMPSTFVKYAKDGNGDNVIDLWNSVSDALTSAANYLNKLGWNSDLAWGAKVQLPSNFKYEITGLDVKKRVAKWVNLGVEITGKSFPPNIRTSIILPVGHKGPAFLITENFRHMLAWNRSINYALVTALLSDELVDISVSYLELEEEELKRDEIIEIQGMLKEMKMYRDKIDGLIGPKTHKAVRKYQKKYDLPIDGHINRELLTLLRNRFG